MDEAQSAIDTLGSLGRRIHRRDVEDNEHRIAAATRDVGCLDRRIETLVAEGDRLTEQIPAWHRWQERFGYVRERLRTLDERIATVEREHGVAQEPGQQAVTDMGIDIGP